LTLPQVGSWLPPAAVIRQCEKTRKPHSTERWLSDGATCLPGSNDSCPQSQCILRTYALNALVHRKRYTQGSRQNRCVSSQDALALRARVSGTGEASGPITQPSCSAVKLSGSLTLSYDCSWWKLTTNLRQGQTCLPLAPR